MFARNLRLMMAPAFATKKHEIAIVKTEAHHQKGIDTLGMAIAQHLQDTGYANERRYWLLAEKAWHLIQAHRMQNLNKQQLMQDIKSYWESPGHEPNLYRYLAPYLEA
jgi:LAO/AO transport system kinase